MGIFSRILKSAKQSREKELDLKIKRLEEKAEEIINHQLKAGLVGNRFKIPMFPKNKIEQQKIIIRLVKFVSHTVEGINMCIFLLKAPNNKHFYGTMYFGENSQSSSILIDEEVPGYENASDLDCFEYLTERGLYLIEASKSGKQLLRMLEESVRRNEF